jgi:hypothetical protein
METTIFLIVLLLSVALAMVLAATGLQLVMRTFSFRTISAEEERPRSYRHL